MSATFLTQGDNDPVDVVEIGSSTHRSGGVYKIKPLGVYAMIDDGELDWKVRTQTVYDRLPYLSVSFFSKVYMKLA